MLHIPFSVTASQLVKGDIPTKLMTSIRQSPCAISPRLMKLQLNLEGGMHVATLSSCYAPTLAATQKEKEQFLGDCL